MLKQIVRMFFVIIGAGIGYGYGPSILKNVFHLSGGLFSSRIFGALLFIAAFVLSTIWVVNYVVSLISWMEKTIKSIPLIDILAGTLGLIVGLSIAYMITPAFRMIPMVGIPLEVFSSVIFGYLGLRIGYTKRNELLQLFAGRVPKRDREKQGAGTAPDTKILDTSAIIDGRIADLARTGFLDGVIVIPSFVLHELQYIADSSDTLKRARGRRGLDILNEMRKDSVVRIQVLDIDFEDLQEVDSKLVRLAQNMKSKLVTNDFNLNKVCAVQNVDVLNINDLANALKPALLPGEVMDIDVIRAGKEERQGIAYLDDGTMIVVEDGVRYIGERVQVSVTTVLQTSAGRMVFAKPKGLHGGLLQTSSIS